MAAATATAATPVVALPPPPARPRVIAPVTAHKLADLLAAIRTGTPQLNVSMLQVTAKRIAESKNLPLDQVPLEALLTVGADFKLDLKSRGYSDKTVRTYAHFANVLLASAIDLGLLRPNLELPAAWERVRVALGKQKGAATVIEYAVSIGRSPEDFTLEDLRAWVALMQRRGRTYAYVDNERSRFRRAMVKCGFQQRLWEVFEWRERYSVPLKQLPAELRAEIQALAQWKQARFAPGRGRRCRHREVSANKLIGFICQLYGYATNVQEQAPLGSLAELITKERVQAFVAWFLNERRRMATPLRANLGLLAAAVRQYPPLRECDFSWFEALMTGIEDDDCEDEQRHNRKTRRALPYDELAKVPDKIRRKREAGNYSPEETALLGLYEFLLRWWLALPWRQRNIRECRIGENPNIFKSEIPSSAAISKPEWVERALERNPHEQFWQMRFSKQETKTGSDFTAIVPLELVPSLEVYLKQYRPLLVEGKDPGTLFVNFRGKPFTDKRLTMLLENLTFQYAGRAINPHLLRDIFAYKWLDEHPEDYLTLSKILWHRDIKTTLQTYGRNFNESNAGRPR